MERIERWREERRKRNTKVELTTGGNNNNNRIREFAACDDDVLASPSPRGVFEVPVLGTDSDSTGSSNYMMTQHGREAAGHVQQWRAMIDALRFKSVRRFSTIPLLAASYEISRRSMRNKLARIRNGDDDDEENDYDGAIDLDGIPTKPSWRNFSYQDLVAATDNFNPGNSTLFSVSNSIPFHITNSVFE